MLPRTLALATGILNRSRVHLAKSITLMESTAEKDKEQAGYLLDYLSTEVGNNNQKPSYRIGITGNLKILRFQSTRLNFVFTMK